VTVIGLAGAALLTFSDTSIRTTVALRDQAGNTYNADGAAQVAIDNLRNGYGFASPHLFDNAYNTACFGLSGTLPLPNFYPATNGQNANAPSSASVVCTADPASGVNGTVVPITGANSPGQAIMTLGQIAGEDGINIKALSGNPFAVKGTIKSNSNINVAAGTLQSTTAVTAVGPCSGTIVSTPAKSCNTGTSLVDPNYVSDAALSTPLAYQAVPANVSASCLNGVVTFNPGYYDDAIALTALMTGSGTCGGSTWWFKPGTYYFDFHNNTNDTDVYRGASTGNSGSADQWGITRGHLVAGTPVDSNGNVISSPGALPTFPGSCQNPIKSTTAAGVQFIFGGDSQLALGGSADAEICGTYSATRPPIGLFGLKPGLAATTTTLTGAGSGATAALKASTVATPQAPFVNPANITDQDNASATWVKGNASLETKTITGSGYAPLSTIPAGSIVKSAVIRVRHGNSGGYTTTGTPSNRDALALTFTPTGGPAIALVPTLNSGVGLTTDSIDIYDGGTSAFVKYVHDSGFTGASMTYSATLKHADTESLDAIQIDISYVTPAFRSQNTKMGPDPLVNTNCLTQAYTGGASGGCAVLSTSALSNFQGAFYVQGTTYVPIAAIDLTLNNATQQILRFGAISRSLWITENGSFSYSGTVIEVPDETLGGAAAPIVFLTVYVCPATTTPSCSADPVDPAHPERGPIKALRVKAIMGEQTAPPSTMTILSWSNLR